MNQLPIISNTQSFVQETLKDAEGGHDWFHIERVWKNTKKILVSEPQADSLVCELAALLHDIADSKFHQGDEKKGPTIARSFLASEMSKPNVLTPAQAEHIVYIIENLSYSKSLESKPKEGDFLDSIELQIVQDADRLDAIGAIGIARAFNFGGFKNRSLYDPNEALHVSLNKANYVKRDRPTIQHFYDKLLKLKDLMNTDSAKTIAQARHEYMCEFLDQFFREWNAEDQLN